MTSVQVLPNLLVAVIALGMALAFLLADRRTPSSRALVLTLAAIGVSILLNVVVARLWALPALVTGLFALPEALAMLALLEWIRRVRRTVPVRPGNPLPGERLLQLGGALAVIYALMSIAWPALRWDAFLGGLATIDGALQPGFWLFAVPVFGGALCAFSAMALLLRQRPDRPERYRVRAMMAAVPFVGAGFVLSPAWSSLAMVVGLMVFLAGALQYHLLQGRRGQFLAQFLSPQVAELVRGRGLRTAMHEQFIELSCVYVDLRGYTAVAEGAASNRVMRILRGYYARVGAVVADFEATIKDQAGDGVLILVGAPINVPDHAQRALNLARRLREATAALIHDWSQEGIWLGVGIGVASGPVTVGIIGAAGRLEYTAVGASVNLAARLCQNAADGEILVSERTVELAGLQAAQMGLQVRSPVRLKGFSEPQGYFLLSPPAPAAPERAGPPSV